MNLHFQYTPVERFFNSLTFRNEESTPEAPIDFAHGCNAELRMGSGVAKDVKLSEPEAYRSYLMSSPEMGEFTYGNACAGNGKIFNFITQRATGSGSFCVYAYYDCLMKYLCHPARASTLVIPEIGCGIAAYNRLAIVYATLMCIEEYADSCLLSDRDCKIIMQVWDGLDSQVESILGKPVDEEVEKAFLSLRKGDSYSYSSSQQFLEFVVEHSQNKGVS